MSEEGTGEAGTSETGRDDVDDTGRSGLPDDAFTTEIPVRYSDVDTYGHVNNATYATYLEEARIDYLEALLGDEGLTGTGERTTGDEEPTASDEDDDDGSDDGIGIVVASLEIDFRRSVEMRDSVTVAVALGDVGTSSFTLSYEIRSAEGVHATAETTMVAFDRERRESVPIPDHWRRAAAEFEGLDAR